jgi:hypothetical protein
LYSKTNIKMKNLLNFAILIATTITAFTSNATVRTVNNNNPSPGQFTTMTAAIAASSSGDTLYIAGSLASYNSFPLDKSLVIIGTGHNPQNQNTSISSIQNIALTTTAARKSQLIGLQFDYLYTTASGIDSITITRCKITNYIEVNNYTHFGWSIRGNVFESTGTNIKFNYNGSIHHMYMNNNVFNGACVDLQNAANNAEIYLFNNLFLRNGDAFTGINNGIYISNNIFYRANTVTNTTACAWNKNLSYQSAAVGTFPSGVNLVNADPLFVTFPALGASFDYAHNYNLQSTSPLINYGTDGTNAGLTGGTAYFEKNGTPGIPQIRSFIIANPNVQAGGTLNINFKSTIKQ